MDFSSIKMPDGFLEEEVRCGYTISEKNKKIMAIEIDLAERLIAVCNKYDIQLMAYAGTLLGAVRHKGFIPWDDDMDFAMTYADFLKLEQHAEEFEHPYFLQTALTDRKYFCGYARLRNSETTGKIVWHQSADYNNGVYIDIYVLNGFVGNGFKLKKQLFERNIIQKMLNTYYSDVGRRGLILALSKLLRGTLLKLIPYEYMVKMYRKIICRYDGKTDRLTVMTHQPDVVLKSWCYLSDFDHIISAPCEFIHIPITANYETFLKNHYGNYMELPPVEKRGVWHADAIEFDPDVPYKEYMRTQSNNM